MKILENGDLVFVQVRKSSLSKAINRVTQKFKADNFEHVGIIEIMSSKVFVLHFSLELGSTKQNLSDFYEQNDKKLIIFRLKSAYQNSIKSALKKANELLGKPYNKLYILDEDSFYCSDFIERIFRDYKIFELILMNFKNPQTGKIDEFWTKFYKEFNLEVPQDKPGSNPNQLASCKKLFKIGNLKYLNGNFLIK